MINRDVEVCRQVYKNHPLQHLHRKSWTCSPEFLVVFPWQGGEAKRGILWWGRWKRGGGMEKWNSPSRPSCNLGSACQCTANLVQALAVPNMPWKRDICFHATGSCFNGLSVFLGLVSVIGRLQQHSGRLWNLRVGEKIARLSEARFFFLMTPKSSFYIWLLCYWLWINERPPPFVKCSHES